MGMMRVVRMMVRMMRVMVMMVRMVRMVMMMVMVMIVRMMTMLVATHCLFRITPKMDDVLLDELQRKFQVPHRLIKNDFS